MPHPFLQLVEDVQREQSKLGGVHLDVDRLGPRLARQAEALFGEGVLSIAHAKVAVTRPKPDMRIRLTQFRTSRSGWKPEHELGTPLELSVLARGNGRVERKQLRAYIPRASILRIEGTFAERRVIATFFPVGDNYAGELIVNMGGEYLESLLHESLVGHSALEHLRGLSCTCVFRSYWSSGQWPPSSDAILVAQLRAGANLNAFLGQKAIDVYGSCRSVNFERTISTEDEWDGGGSDMIEDVVLPTEVVTMLELHLRSRPRKLRIPSSNPLLELRKVSFHVISRQTDSTDEIAPQIGITAAVMLGQQRVSLWAPYVHDEAVLVFQSSEKLRLALPDLSQLANLVGGSDWYAHLGWPADKGAYLREFSLSYHLVHRKVTLISFTLEAPSDVAFVPKPAHFQFKDFRTTVLIEAPQEQGRDVTVAHEGTLVVDDMWRFEAVADVGESPMVTAWLGSEHDVRFGALKQSPFLQSLASPWPQEEDDYTEHYLRLFSNGFELRTRAAFDDASEIDDRAQGERTFWIDF